MSVFQKLFFSIVLLSGSLIAQGQTLGDFSFFKQVQLGSPVWQNPSSMYQAIAMPKGAVVYTKGVTTGSLPMYIGESDQIRVNGPVDSGKPVLITGKGLLESSINVQILDEEGSTIPYEDRDIIFEQDKEQLSLDLVLTPGIYTIQVPVADGIVNKTVIIQ